MIRRGDELRVGPLRIPVLMNKEGKCEVMVCCGNVLIGSLAIVDEDVLERIKIESEQCVPEGSEPVL